MARFALPQGEQTRTFYGKVGASSNELIERTFDASFVNEVVNHPSVETWVRGPCHGNLDLSPLIADERNVVLTGEHGFAAFVYRVPGVYELHAAVRPEGHGWWALAAARTALDWIFENNDAVAVLAPVPEHNRPARNIVAALGFELKQVLPAGWLENGERVSLYVYLLMRRGWMQCQ